MIAEDNKTSLASLVAAASTVAQDHLRIPTSPSSAAGAACEEVARSHPSTRVMTPSSGAESDASSSPAPVSRSSSGADEEESVSASHGDPQSSPSSMVVATKKRKEDSATDVPTVTLNVDGISTNAGYGPFKKRVKGECHHTPSSGERRDGLRSPEPVPVLSSQPTGLADHDKLMDATEASEAKPSVESPGQADHDNDGNDEEEILSIVRDELSADDKKLQGQNVVGHALLKLANLCDMNDRGKRNADFFLDTIGVGSIILLMKKTPGNPKIQGCGAALLLNLMNLASSKGRVMEAIHRMGGLEVISSAIHSLPNDEKVQLYGCAVLQKWTKGGSDEKKALVNAHGIEAFVAALRKHRKDVRIQRLGCKALSTLCLEKDHLPRVLQAGGFSAIIAAGERYPTDPIASVSALNAARQYLMLSKPA